MINNLKKCTLIFMYLITNIINGQQQYKFSLEGIDIKFSITENQEIYSSTIEIYNKNNYDIYVPELIDDKLNSFIIGKKLYFYYGLSFSALGEQNPSSNIQLILVKSKSTFSHKFENKKVTEITESFFGVEYVTTLKKKLRKKLRIDYDNYTINKKIFTTELKMCGNISD